MSWYWYYWRMSIVLYNKYVCAKRYPSDTTSNPGSYAQCEQFMHVFGVDVALVSQGLSREQTVLFRRKPCQSKFNWTELSITIVIHHWHKKWFDVGLPVLKGSLALESMSLRVFKFLNSRFNGVHQGAEIVGHGPNIVSKWSWDQLQAPESDNKIYQINIICYCPVTVKLKLTVQANETASILYDLATSLDTFQSGMFIYMSSTRQPGNHHSLQCFLLLHWNSRCWIQCMSITAVPGHQKQLTRNNGFQTGLQ